MMLVKGNKQQIEGPSVQVPENAPNPDSVFMEVFSDRMESIRGPERGIQVNRVENTSRQRESMFKVTEVRTQNH